MRAAIITAIAVMAATTSAAVGQPRVPGPLQAGTSTIGGTVFDAITKKPLAGCTVRAGADMRSGAVVTDADGWYEFREIADGNYMMGVDCPSHLRNCLRAGDSTSESCSVVPLFRDQRRVDVDFAMDVGGTVRGHVLHSSGSPVRRATVQLGGAFFGDRLVLPGPGSVTATKEDGSFEITNVPAGSWRLMAEIPQPPDAPRSINVFYPGVLARDAAGAVDVAAGKVKDGVVITVPPVLDRTLTVRVPPPDATMTSVIVSLIRAIPFMARHLEIDAEGKAVLDGLIDGRYFVTATAVSAQQRWADYQAIDFLDQSVEVALQLQPAGRIRGRIIGDRGMPPLDGATIGAAWIDGGVTLNPASPDEAPISADGSFEIDGVFGRRLLQLGRFEPGWRIYSVSEDRSDVTTTGVAVTPGSVTEVTIIVRPR
jgi:hypothetical protein